VIHRAGRAIWLAVLAGLLLRLVFGFGYWVGKPLTHDEREYLSLAVNLVEGRGFGYPAAAPGEPVPERFGRAPLYPLFLAAVIGPTGLDELTAVRLAQSVLGALGVWLVALVATRAAGPRAGLIAAWIAAIYPPLVWTPAYVFSETLYMVLALSHVLVAGRVLGEWGESGGSRERGWLLWCGVVGGLAALTRPAHLFFLLLLGVWLLTKRRPRDAVLIAVGALLVIAPWTVRNVRQYGRVVLIASEGGITFWTGNHPLSPGEGDMAANPAIKRDNQRLRAAHKGLSSEELEPVYYREAMKAITRDPVWWVNLLIRKAFYTWVPLGPSYTLHSTRYVVASLVSYGLLLAGGIAGAVAVIRARRWPVALGLMLASAVLVCVVFFPQERFRIPVIDPALIVLAASGLALLTPQPSGLGDRTRA
jgi:4-amino-4-deoxy-L-arabinose transferase-like glycosyltransferase